MIIFPAIDIQAGRVVRLRQGLFDQVSIYADDPLSVANQWVAQGAQWLHVVDLDGARLGKIENCDTITRIAKTVPVPVQTGGGIRGLQDVERYVDSGISRVILGTRAIEDRDFLREALNRWPDKIAVSLDCSSGKIAQRGWTQTTGLNAVDFARELEKAGVRCLIYTDIQRDGMMSGPDFGGLNAILNAVSIPIIVSGGIAGIEDIRKLCSLKATNLLGAITGKALYEGTLKLEDAIKLCSQNA